MLLIRAKKQPTNIKGKLIKVSASEIAGRIEFVLALLALPTIMIWRGIGFMSAFEIAIEIAIENIKIIATVVFVAVWIGKTFFNLGQKIKTE